MPAQKQKILERKASGGKNKKVAGVRKEPRMMTESVQREKKDGQNLCDSVESLPNLSGILIRTINLCKSAQGPSLIQLNQVLGAKGYSVSRYCPSIQRQLMSLSSKGALVKVTHKAGSSLFVIKKHQRKVAAADAPESSEEIIHMKKMGAERTNTQSASENMKRVAGQAKSFGLKAAEANWKVQGPNRKTVSNIKKPQSFRGKARSSGKTE